MRDEQRPPAGLEGEEAFGGAGTSLRHEALERLLSNVDGALVVMVVTPKAATRRRVFLTLAAAERYAARAAALGHLVRVVLVKLDPVAEVLS